MDIVISPEDLDTKPASLPENIRLQRELLEAILKHDSLQRIREEAMQEVQKVETLLAQGLADAAEKVSGGILRRFTRMAAKFWYAQAEDLGNVMYQEGGYTGSLKQARGLLDMAYTLGSAAHGQEDSLSMGKCFVEASQYAQRAYELLMCASPDPEPMPTSNRERYISTLVRQVGHVSHRERGSGSRSKAAKRSKGPRQPRPKPVLAKSGKGDKPSAKKKGR